jgi:hypothetical protein
MTLVPLVHIRVKALEDYGPRQEPKDIGVEYGNYYVTDIAYEFVPYPTRTLRPGHLYMGPEGAAEGDVEI